MRRMKKPAQSPLAKKLVKLAAAKGCRDPLNINVWSENDAGEVTSSPGLFVPVTYRRADGKPRLKGQRGGNVRTKEEGC